MIKNNMIKLEGTDPEGVVWINPDTIVSITRYNESYMIRCIGIWYQVKSVDAILGVGFDFEGDKSQLQRGGYYG